MNHRAVVHIRDNAPRHASLCAIALSSTQFEVNLLQLTAIPLHGDVVPGLRCQLERIQRAIAQQLSRPEFQTAKTSKNENDQ